MPMEEQQRETKAQVQPERTVRQVRTTLEVIVGEAGNRTVPAGKKRTALSSGGEAVVPFSVCLSCSIVSLLEAEDSGRQSLCFAATEGCHANGRGKRDAANSRDVEGGRGERRAQKTRDEGQKRPGIGGRKNRGTRRMTNERALGGGGEEETRRESVWSEGVGLRERKKRRSATG